MDTNDYQALKMRVQQGLKSFESALDEMFGHVVAANARAAVLPSIPEPPAISGMEVVKIPAQGVGAADLQADSGDAAKTADPVAGAFGDNPPDDALKTDNV